jgi:hypothetical protein
MLPRRPEKFLSPSSRIPMRDLPGKGAAVFGEIHEGLRDDEPSIGVFWDEIPDC